MTDATYYRARYYDPSIGRFISEDPTQFAGSGTNFYAYVRNSPISYYDPSGLKTSVIAWKPVGWGESSQGHVSVAINGTSYSWGPGNGGRMDMRPAEDYEDLNLAFRNGDKYDIALTPAQEALLSAYLKNYSGKYGPINNNCVRPFASWMDQNGFDGSGIKADFGEDLTPKDLTNTLMSIPGLVTGRSLLTPTPTGTGGGRAF